MKPTRRRRSPGSGVCSPGRDAPKTRAGDHGEQTRADDHGERTRAEDHGERRATTPSRRDERAHREAHAESVTARTPSRALARR
jgi:hypothetical protein